MDRLIRGAERLAGAFLAFVVALTFVAVVLRYVFAVAIPDSYDLGRNFLGILIFWGIAVTCYRGEHITVELFVNVLPAPARRALDLLSTVFTIVCMAAFAYAMADKVLDTRATGEETYDLRMPVWPFYAIAWLGLAGSVVLLLVRLARQARETAPPPTHSTPASH